jgi:colanic acid biosynthesis glycosyl transferase WcaI
MLPTPGTERFTASAPADRDEGIEALAPTPAGKPGLRKPSLLIVTQVYPPDPTAVGQHLADVAETMAADGWRVIVYAASRGYDDPRERYCRKELRNGVDVYRLPFSSFGKGSIARRLFGQALFLLQAVVRASLERRVDRVLVSTVPPFSNLGGVVLSWVHRAPLTWWVMDLNPDQLIRVGKLHPRSLFARGFDWINRLTLRRAAAVVALDEFIRDRIVAKAIPAGRIEIVPPWSHHTSEHPQPEDGGPFRREHRLEGRCVVMYSGNHGLTNPLETLLNAAKILREHPSLAFVFVGGGVRKPAVEEFIRSNNLSNALSLPYQPLEKLRDSLPAADIHMVSISSEAVGVSHSCKIYGAMAAGRPIVALAPERSHVGTLLKEHGCGWTIEQGDVPGLVDLLRKVAAMPAADRLSIGTLGAYAIREHFPPAGLIGRICRLIDDSSCERRHSQPT